MSSIPPFCLSLLLFRILFFYALIHSKVSGIEMNLVYYPYF